MSLQNQRAEILNLFNDLIKGKASFEQVAFSVYDYQKNNNPIFKQYLTLLDKWDFVPKDLDDLIYLPIQFFKTNIIKSGIWEEEEIFKSSGTTGQIRSQHFMKELNLYHENTKLGFEKHFDLRLNDCIFLALLPGYIGNEHSSLIEMVRFFMNNSASDNFDFYADDHESLRERLQQIQSDKQVVLFGVSFALLEFAEQYEMDLSDVIVIETGGMKTSKKEITKAEILQTLKDRFNLKNIYSEYGMTELLSQAYTDKNEKYISAQTMHVTTTQLNDPFAKEKFAKTGQLSIIDLANIDTCSFIATQDLGRCYADGSFEVLGRITGSEMRGCNLLLET